MRRRGRRWGRCRGGFVLGGVFFRVWKCGQIFGGGGSFRSGIQSPTGSMAALSSVIFFRLQGGKMVDLGVEWCKMRFVMFGAAFFVGLLCAFAVAGAGGALLSDVSGSGHASSLFSVLSAAGSAVVGFAAVVFPAEWMRFKMVKVGPQAAFPLAMGKFGMTVSAVDRRRFGDGRHACSRRIRFWGRACRCFWGFCGSGTFPRISRKLGGIDGFREFRRLA